MHAPYRIASPPAPVRHEEADSYEAQLLAGRKRYWGQMAVLIASATSLSLAVVTAMRDRPTGAERARQQETLRAESARSTLYEARGQLDRAQQSFDEGLHATLRDPPVLAANATACPITLGDPEKLARGRSMIPLLLVSHDAKAERRLWSPSVAREKEDVTTGESLLRGVNPLSAVVYTDALDANPIDRRLTHDVVVVYSHWKSPVATSETAFEPGAIDGRAYVFDFTTRRVVCAGEVHTASSKSLAYTYNATHDQRASRLDQSLQEDMELQIARAVTAPGAMSALR